MKKNPPAIREDDVSIQIDQKRGHWPHLAAFLLDDPDGKLAIALVVDDNEGGQVIGENVGRAAILLTHKKARALRDFLNRVIE